MSYKMKTFWYLLKKYTKAFKREYASRTNRVMYYHDRISDHVKKYPALSNEFTPQSNLVLDPSLYPYDKEKAESALKEVTQWILEDERKVNVK